MIPEKAFFAQKHIIAILVVAGHYSATITLMFYFVDPMIHVLSLQQFVLFFGVSPSQVTPTIGTFYYKARCPVMPNNKCRKDTPYIVGSSNPTY